MRRWMPLRCLVAATALLAILDANPGLAQPATLTPAQAQALVDRALGNELRAAEDTSHRMRYELRKTTPRLTTTKEIVETGDGEVARLIALDDQALSAADEQKEEARLSALASDPGRQRHRKQSEDADAARALKVLRALPRAFLYQYAGPVDSPAGTLQRFTFKPNPAFTPPDLETEVLTAMSGEIRIDPASERVTHLEGHLDDDVDFGWGILGRLNKGGWIAIDQADVSGGEWRMVRFQMQMSGRVVFKSRVFDTTEEESHYAPVPAGLRYAQAIAMLRGSDAGTDGAPR
ncbi:MAG TPA: hypothetical protein VMD55_01445 [Terracidiphilus sp.]|nr:hypothetical protein [Terracidiphilus sp.]